MEALHRSIEERSLYWRTRAKVRYVLEGDENTKFFHASATCRLRRNTIPSLSIEGVDVTKHQDKADVLKSFFSELLGTVTPVSWPFDLSSLYTEATPLASSFSAPFTPEEIKLAFTSMNKLSSPGPDGFGPAFFTTFWDLISGMFWMCFHLSTTKPSTQPYQPGLLGPPA
jgi:hypothetical protein